MFTIDTFGWISTSLYVHLFVQGLGVGSLVLAFALGFSAGKALSCLSMARAVLAPNRPWRRLFVLLRAPAIRSWTHGRARSKFGLWASSGLGCLLCAGLAALTALAPTLPSDAALSWGPIALRLIVFIDLAGFAICLALLFYQLPCDAFEAAVHWAEDPIFSEHCRVLESEAMAHEESLDIAQAASPLPSQTARARRTRTRL